jgi:hypothetical protein
MVTDDNERDWSVRRHQTEREREHERENTQREREGRR